CLLDGGPVPRPVDPLLFAPSLPPFGASREEVDAFQEAVRPVVSDLAERSRMKYEEHETKDIEGFVERRVGDLVEAASTGGSFASKAGPVGMLPFRVDRQSQGLAVHSAPAFLLGFPVYFNAPTTPVHGWLSPGLWSFGARGPGVPGLVLDPGIFDAKLGQA